MRLLLFLLAEAWLSPSVGAAQEKPDPDPVSMLSNILEISEVGSSPAAMLKTMPRTEDNHLNARLETLANHSVNRGQKAAELRSGPVDITDSVSELADLASALGRHVGGVFKEAGSRLRDASAGEVVPLSDVLIDRGCFVCSFCDQEFPFAGKSASEKLAAISRADQCLAKHMANGEISRDQAAEYERKQETMKRALSERPSSLRAWLDDEENSPKNAVLNREETGGDQGFASMVAEVIGEDRKPRATSTDTAISGRTTTANPEVAAEPGWCVHKHLPNASRLWEYAAFSQNSIPTEPQPWFLVQGGLSEPEAKSLAKRLNGVMSGGRGGISRDESSSGTTAAEAMQAYETERLNHTLQQSFGTLLNSMGEEIETNSRNVRSSSRLPAGINSPDNNIPAREKPKMWRVIWIMEILHSVPTVPRGYWSEGWFDGYYTIGQSDTGTMTKAQAETEAARLNALRKRGPRFWVEGYEDKKRK